MVFLVRIANTPEGIQAIKDMRGRAKVYGMKLTVYGRAKRKEVFEKTGRKYRAGRGGNGNNISLSSKEAPYCYEWVVYRHELPEENAIAHKAYDVRSIAWYRGVEVRKSKVRK
jgi:hypothetical protein